MKTKLLSLLLIILAFSSCNTAKHYANYRFGGKSEKENTISTTSIAELQPEAVVKVIDSVIPDANIGNAKVEMSKEEFGTNKKSELASLKKVELKIDKSFHKINRAIKTLPMINPLKEKDSLKEKRKDSLYYQNSKKEIKGSDILDAFIGILLAASLIFAVITYLASVNFAIADVILIALAIGLGILLCIGLGKLIMGMFPGMSKKKKNSILNFLDRFSFAKRKNKSRMKYYGGMSVKGAFWIGTGLIAVGLLFASIYTAPIWVFDILITLFSSWLVGCLITGAFVAIFEGISR